MSDYRHGFPPAHGSGPYVRPGSSPGRSDYGNSFDDDPELARLLGPRTSGTYAGGGNRQQIPDASRRSEPQPSGGRRRRAAQGTATPPPTARPPRTRAEARARAREAARRSKRRFIDYPRADKTGLARWVPSFTQVAICCLFFLALGMAVFTYAYIKTPVPDPNEFAEAQAVIYQYAGGRQDIYRDGENRIKVSYEQMPPAVRYAPVALENRTFFTDNGISPKGILRALWSNLKGGSTQGGSTITQQYVKNYYLTQERTLERKLKEFIIALKIDKQMRKDQILEGYLNTIYFGRRSYGVATAAETYFGKPVDKLTIGEAAVLASILRSPGFYDPYIGNNGKLNPANLNRLKARYALALNELVKLQRPDWHFTQAQADEWKRNFPMPKPPVKKKNELGGQRGYIVEMVNKELKERYGLTEAKLDRGGYRVVTTIDPKAQRAAEDAVQKEFWDKAGEVDIPSDVHVALTAVEPGTGKIKAVYGDKNYLTRPYNGAATAGGAQAGSTFKVFTLAAALREGISLESRFAGDSPYYIPTKNGASSNEPPVDNENDKDWGEGPDRRIDMITATKNSINSAFVDLAVEVGPQKVKQAAIDAGIPETEDLKANARVTLGTASPSLVHLVNAYATFAAEGVRATPHIVEAVYDASGEEEIPPEKEIPEPERKFEEGVVRDVIWALRETAEQGSARNTQGAQRTVAAKTGTGQNNESALLVGFAKQLAAGVKIYRGDGHKPLYGVGAPKGNTTKRLGGGTYPARIWAAFMYAALRGQQDEKFPEPAHIGRVLNPLPEPEPTPQETLPPEPSPNPGDGQGKRGDKPTVRPTFNPGNPGDGCGGLFQEPCPPDDGGGQNPPPPEEDQQRKQGSGDGTGNGDGT
ncbi:Multimodular transpeptidase-transglycosylase [Carbonactinospora thermoautotrophica]|uniref:Multimodular transpeptidase-transglycosylase n=2 Tax=Carbonactinospora thermoautotrophica TaxID=1469144 RepID=A0A132MLX5_9ACTN|nr:transglycosylase domain-containing protein [Carbonactinospora thermoautotrophica]KWW98411.1 Multimodular transpeptidase-transglycosylase [Carbonactinospora thermoautotrophica]